MVRGYVDARLNRYLGLWLLGQSVILSIIAATLIGSERNRVGWLLGYDIRYPSSNDSMCGYFWIILPKEGVNRFRVATTILKSSRWVLWNLTLHNIYLDTKIYKVSCIFPSVKMPFSRRSTITPRVTNMTNFMRLLNQY